MAATASLLTAASCDTTPAPIHTVHTDSAGIPIATAVTPLWDPGEGWTVEAEPMVEIGTVTGPPEYQLGEVVAAVRLSNGDIVVADRGASELRSYDAAGNFQWSAGRFGEGPSEFESLDFVGTTIGDTLVTYDASLMRAQLFDPGRRAGAHVPGGDHGGQCRGRDGGGRQGGGHRGRSPRCAVHRIR